VRFARSLDWDAATSPTGARVKIDPERVYYLGHSQGAVSGIAPLALEPDVSASVLSGGGGLLIESLLNKKLPNDLAAAIAIGLADPTLDRYHPVLNLAQAFAEPSDGVNHAGHLLADPLGDDPPRSVFQVYGVGDNYTPDETQIALARALRVAQMPGTSTPLQGITTATPPVRANRAAGRATGVVGLYERPGANDAHFVLFDRADTRRQVAHFFGTAARDGLPTVVAPAP
jgi:hypothetical protein